MKKNKVCVFMSTYNGSEYVSEQINSILKQVNVDVLLYIRDDGSTDHTYEILEKFSKKHYNIIIYKGENIGFERSFATISREIVDADYYAFSDQDDFWLPDRLYNAIKILEKEKNCALYGSEFYITDANLTPLRFLYGDNFEKIDSMIQNYGIIGGNMFGCTMVWNKELQKVLLKHMPRVKVSQDVWTQLVAEIVDAKIILDKNPTIYHRLHDTNTAGISSGFFALLKKAYKIYFLKASNSKYEIVREATTHYISNDDFSSKYQLREYVLDYPRSITSKINLILSNCFKMKERKRRLFYILLVLINRY